MQQLLSHCIPQVHDAASDKPSFERRQKEIKPPALRRQVNCFCITGATPVGADNDSFIPGFFLFFFSRNWFFSWRAASVHCCDRTKWAWNCWMTAGTLAMLWISQIFHREKSSSICHFNPPSLPSLSSFTPYSLMHQLCFASLHLFIWKTTLYCHSFLPLTLTPTLSDGTDVQIPLQPFVFSTGLGFRTITPCSASTPPLVFPLSSTLSPPLAPPLPPSAPDSHHLDAAAAKGGDALLVAPWMQGHGAENPLWFLLSSSNSASQIQFLLFTTSWLFNLSWSSFEKKLIKYYSGSCIEGESGVQPGKQAILSSSSYPSPSWCWC